MLSSRRARIGKHNDRNVSATPSSLPKGTQRAVESAWREKIRKLPLSVSAEEFYAGRAFGLAVETARMSNARLYVLSAGLGLLPAERPIPVYGLTFRRDIRTSVASKVLGRVRSGGLVFPSALMADFGRLAGCGKEEIGAHSCSDVPPLCGNGRRKLEPSAAENVWPFEDFRRLARDRLPVSLHPAIAPYDERLNVIFQAPVPTSPSEPCSTSRGLSP